MDKKKKKLIQIYLKLLFTIDSTNIHVASIELPRIRFLGEDQEFQSDSNIFGKLF